MQKKTDKTKKLSLNKSVVKGLVQTLSPEQLAEANGGISIQTFTSLRTIGLEGC